ncbi:uncharacterized protein LOC122083474 [Macadamia integrifolia]|uniref:uncharacterized protein LOC122083474 n=1 Tax=Macadamia integrifolia TaxID=60698 RepID=UPI001C4E637F|nr:uncharacterized protein LOC122083474 [Macadamia integrifolia]XP_042507235.1 uncharacterized protein LOC122083474 [Macadamia integrifolia]XP_042507236.1 uncharacterized protein LOC122083474 [Macadamia integrifolia]
MGRESERERCLEWWEEVMFLLRRVWSRTATRLGIRKSGLLKLRHDVSECEYEDVHVMWDMLKKTDTELGRSPSKKQKRALLKFLMWARNSTCLCRSS